MGPMNRMCKVGFVNALRQPIRVDPLPPLRVSFARVHQIHAQRRHFASRPFAQTRFDEPKRVGRIEAQLGQSASETESKRSGSKDDTGRANAFVIDADVTRPDGVDVGVFYEGS